MARGIDLFFKLLEVLVVACLVAMVIMVFGNVVLRYALNSGILISEEMSRYCFIWLTYIGAMVGGKKLCFFLSESLMLLCNLLFLLGTWKMHELQVTNVSPVVGISMIWIYGIGYVVGVVMSLMNLHQLFLLLSGQLTESDLVVVVESEDSATLPAEPARELRP
jgi:TRAP-type C4-dicarboxylate transport system permease small subunit